MKLYELIEKEQQSIRSIASAVIDRHNRGNASAIDKKWLSELSKDEVFMRDLYKEALRYYSPASSYEGSDLDGWLDAAALFAEAKNILEEYRLAMEIASKQKNVE